MELKISLSYVVISIAITFNANYDITIAGEEEDNSSLKHLTGLRNNYDRLRVENII